MSDFSKKSQEQNAEQSGYFYHQIVKKDAEIHELKELIIEFVKAFEKASAKSSAWDGNRLLLQRAREATK
jgi:hypothetical protein